MHVRKAKLSLCFVLSIAGATAAGSSALAKGASRHQAAGNKEYVLSLGSALPSDAAIVRNGAHGTCSIGQSRDTITYVRPNSSYKGVDECTVGYAVGTAFCEYGLFIDFSVSEPVLQFSGTSACY